MPDRVDMENHYEGNPNCSACWSKPYRCKCGGLIHQEIFDYVGENNDLELTYLCDRCGEDYEYES